MSAHALKKTPTLRKRVGDLALTRTGAGIFVITRVPAYKISWSVEVIRMFAYTGTLTISVHWDTNEINVCELLAR